MAGEARRASAQTSGRRIVIVSGSVGAGHDGVAHELESRLAALGHRVDVVDMLDGFPALVRIGLGSAYVAVLRVFPWLYSLIYWAVERSRVTQRIAGWACASAIPWLLTVTGDADVVVATYPPASRALGRLRSSGRLTAPVITYLTDPAPNYMWMHDGVDAFLAAGQHTVTSAWERYGVSALDVGPVVSHRYQVAMDATRACDAGTLLGLTPGTPYALLLLGSLGVGNMRAAVSALTEAGVVPVVLCGRNARLRRRLSRLAGCVALGWRDDVPTLLAGAAFVVHNAGGLSLSESLAAGVPAVTFAAIPGHGRDNARVLDDADVAPWARTPAALTAMARQLAQKRLRRPALASDAPEEFIAEFALTPVSQRQAAAG